MTEDEELPIASHCQSRDMLVQASILAHASHLLFIPLTLLAERIFAMDLAVAALWGTARAEGE